MRPLAVLALVLAAALALIFAYVSISDSGSRGETTGRVTLPATPEAVEQRSKASLEEAAPIETEVVREAVASPEGTEAAPGAFPNVLRGTVFSPAHTPVEGATVSIYREGSSQGLRGLAAFLNHGNQNQKAVRVTRTDEAGRYELKGLPPSTQAMLVVEHEDYQRAEVPGVAIPEEGEVREDVSLEDGYRIFGYVTAHATGQPVEGATLLLDTPLSAQLPPDRPSPDRMTALTGPDGRFDFQHVAPGSKWLVARAEGFATLIKNDVVVQVGTGTDRHLSVDLRLLPEQQITGTVFGPNRQGIEGATLEAMSYNADTMSKGSAVADADGNFVIRGLAAAEYSIVARAPGFAEDREIRVSAPKDNLTFELAELGGVMGRIVDGRSGRALSDFRISARMVNKSGSYVGRVVQAQNVRGADNGAFHLRGLPAGSYVVQASAKGYADTRSDVFQVGQAITVPDVVVQMGQGGTLTGRVVDAYSNEPIAGAVVQTQDDKWVDSPFTRALGGLMSRTTTEATARTDKDGNFELELLTPGTYQINVAANGRTTDSKNGVVVVAGQTRDMGSIKLYSGSKITGAVFTGDGRRAVGATVSLHPSDGIMSRNYEARTNSEGQYTFTNVSPGSYTLSAARQKQDGNPFGVIVDMKHSEVQLSLVDGREYIQDLRLGPNN